MPSLLDRRIATTVGRGRQLSVLKWKKQSEKPTSRYLETSIIVGLKIVISKNGLLYSACMSAKLLLWCLTLCDTIDCNLLGSSVLGILQARILEWVGCHALLQGIFLTQGSNLHLLMSPALAGGFFTTSATWEAPVYPEKTIIQKKTHVPQCLLQHYLQ